MLCKYITVWYVFGMNEGKRGSWSTRAEGRRFCTGRAERSPYLEAGIIDMSRGLSLGQDHCLEAPAMGSGLTGFMSERGLEISEAMGQKGEP
jgi:hypothetical protein